MSKTKSTEPEIGLTEPNAALGLAKFDYTNLNGKAFEEYQSIVSSLLFNQKYDFEEWLASSKLKFRINEDTGEKYQYMDGVILNGAKPISIVRISAIQARELNAHVTHLTGNEYRGTSKYYLLKKAAKEGVEV